MKTVCMEAKQFVRCPKNYASWHFWPRMRVCWDCYDYYMLIWSNIYFLWGILSFVYFRRKQRGTKRFQISSTNKRNLIVDLSKMIFWHGTNYSNIFADLYLIFFIRSCIQNIFRFPSFYSINFLIPSYAWC